MAKSTTKQTTKQTTKPIIKPIYGTVTTSLNVRAGPSKNSPRLDYLPDNSKIIVLSRTEDREWLFIQSISLIGWVMSKYVKIIDRSEEIPVISTSELYQHSSQISDKEIFSPIPISEIYKTTNGFEIAPVAQVLGRISMALCDYNDGTTPCNNLE